MPAEAATQRAVVRAGGIDPQLEGAGAVAGLRVWRVENRRGDGAGAAAKFGVAAWPTSQYGAGARRRAQGGGGARQA